MRSGFILLIGCLAVSTGPIGCGDPEDQILRGIADIIDVEGVNTILSDYSFTRCRSRS